MSRVKNVFRGQKGFTLIELLIVIVIIGILAAIAIPNILDLTGTADRGAQTSNMRTLLSDIEAYRARTGDYPENKDALEDFRAYEEIDDASTSTSYNSDDNTFTFSATFDFGDEEETLYISTRAGFTTTSPE